MARISAKVLDALQRIYRYVPADRSPATIDVDLGVQLVHDVGPDARYGTGAGPWQQGWNYITRSNTHVGVGTITNLFIFTDPAFAFQGMPDPYDRSEQMQWIHSAQASQNDAADFGNAVVNFIPSADAIGYSPNSVPTSPEQNILNTNVVVTGTPGTTGDELTRYGQTRFPIPVILRPGGGDANLRFASTSITAGTVTILLGTLCWLGSRFIKGPGI